MSKTEKIDCKYWDKCYQKNSAHHEKYNHPPKHQPASQLSSSVSDNESNKRKRSPAPFLDLASKTSTKRNSLSPNPSANAETTEGASTSSRKSPRRNSKSPVYLKAKQRSKTPEFSTKTEHQSKDDNTNKKLTNTETPNEKKNSKEMDITDEYNEVMKNLSGKNYFEIFQKRVRYSTKAEYQDLLKTPEFIRHKFLVEMPSDFYKFWDFCLWFKENKLNKNSSSPQTLFEKFELYLVGPFDYLSGKFNDAKICEPGNYLRHWRFYYDVPEFQTCFVKAKSCVHYGYWRDDPKDKENLLMARNDSNKNCEFEFIGGNCFETVLYFLDNDCPSTPFNQKQITDMKKSIQQYARDNGILLDSLKEMKKNRDKKVVCKTFHKAGLVVPFDHKTEVGYRSLIESDATIKKILSVLDKSKDENIVESVIESLQPIVTAANIAMDECDFGTSVELGIDLFCSGYESLHDVIRSLLIPGYSMLQKPQFIAIMKAHLENRQKGNNLNMFK